MVEMVSGMLAEMFYASLTGEAPTSRGSVHAYQSTTTHDSSLHVDGQTSSILCNKGPHSQAKKHGYPNYSRMCSRDGDNMEKKCLPPCLMVVSQDLIACEAYYLLPTVKLVT